MSRRNLDKSTVQGSLLMIHILDSCIAGKNDNNRLGENMVVLFNKHLCKSYISPSLRLAASDSVWVDGAHNTDSLSPHH